jgi:hypothetical protein
VLVFAGMVMLLMLKRHIPVKVDQWDEKRPGLEGVYAFTIDCVDIATTWTEQRAVKAKDTSR